MRRAETYCFLHGISLLLPLLRATRIARFLRERFACWVPCRVPVHGNIGYARSMEHAFPNARHERRKFWHRGGIGIFFMDGWVVTVLHWPERGQKCATNGTRALRFAPYLAEGRTHVGEQVYQVLCANTNTYTRMLDVNFPTCTVCAARAWVARRIFRCTENPAHHAHSSWRYVRRR